MVLIHRLISCCFCVVHLFQVIEWVKVTNHFDQISKFRFDHTLRYLPRRLNDG